MEVGWAGGVLPNCQARKIRGGVVWIGYARGFKPLKNKQWSFVSVRQHNAGLVFYIKWGDVLMEMRPVGCFRWAPPGAAVHTRPGSPFQVSRSVG